MTHELSLFAAGDRHPAPCPRQTPRGGGSAGACPDNSYVIHPSTLPGQRARTALHGPAAKGHTAAVQVLLAAVDLLDAADTGGLTALHMAARADKGATMQLLLAAGACVDARDQYRQTPLHHAAGLASPASVALLLGAGAAVDAADDRGSTPLHMAVADSVSGLSCGLQAALG